MIDLSIVIPAYNEGLRLPDTLTLVKEYVDTHEKMSIEVLVVDDGSKDNTVDLVRQRMERFPELRIIENKINKGKGKVVKQGMLESKGNYRLFMDADHSTPINELDKLLQFIPEHDVIFGSRYLDSKSIKVKQPLKRRIISRISNLIIQFLLLPNIKDTQCGFKLFSAQAAEDVFSIQRMEGWSFDIELLTIAKLHGYALKEVPVDWFDAKHSTFHASKEAGKFLKDLWTIYRLAHTKQYQVVN